MTQTKMKKLIKILAIALTGIGLIAMLVVGAMFLVNNEKVMGENQSIVLADTSGTCGDNLTWTLSNGVLTISGTGAITSSPWTSGAVEKVIIQNGVTSIGNSIFSNHYGLLSIEIPSTLTNIGNYVFYQCNGLNSIIIDDENPIYNDGNGSNCIVETSTNTLVLGCKTTLIPNNITVIGRDAFHDCNGLHSITIPNAVTTIEGSAFYNCYNLASITIPNSVTSIGSSAFYNCSSLTSIEIPNSIENIGASAFKQCTNLTSIEIPNSVTSTGGYVFYECTNLMSVKIPSSLTSISEFLFYGCSSLTSINIPNSITSMENWAFGHCTSLKSIEIPSGVTIIEHDTFHGCSGLTMITIPNSISSIGDYAFNGCKNLTVIMKAIDPPSLISNRSFGVIGSGEVEKIFVPNSCVNIYKSTHNWSAYSDIIEGYNPEDQFTVTYQNYDYSFIAEEQVFYGDMPVYNSAPPTKEATQEYVYEFDGWEETILPATEDATYTATYRQSGAPYEITYNSNYETIEEEVQDVNYGENFTTYGNSVFDRSGYRIVSWNSEANGSGDVYPVDTEMSYELTQNLTLYAQWETEYSITYTLDGGTVNPANPETYTAVDDAIRLINPTKVGYTFTGWTGSNGSDPELVVTIPTGTTGNLSYTVNWTPTEYTITTIVDGVETEQNYTIESSEITLNNPTKDYYEFIGWSGTGISGTSMSVTIPAGSYGDREYIANWEAVEYTITYILNDGTATNPSVYTVESDSFTLSNPTKDYYDFTGWSGIGISGTSMSVTIPTGSYGHRTYTANFSPTVYTITTVVDGVETEQNYTIESGEITLENPSKVAYDFTGWTGTDLEEETMEVVIPTGSYGDREYTANWTPIEYTITYILNDGTATNPGVYTVESDSFTLSNPTKDYYDFTGWTGANGSTPQTTVTIPTGSYGNREYTANFSPTVYTITTIVDGVETEQNYTIESSEITLTNPTKDYYNFTGWIGTDLEEETMEVVIPSGSTGDREYTANWEAIEYTITYTLDGGTASNPETYTIESENITLVNPTKKGYTFLGWTGSNGENPQTTVTIPAGSTGNREYTANWEIITYTITTIVQGVETEQNYTVESASITLVQPTRDGATFRGWTGTNGTTPQKNITIAHGSIGNRTYTANWTLTNYTLKYTLYGGTVSPANPTKFNVETETFTLNNPTKANYDFLGWTGGDLTEPTLEVTIETGSLNNRTYTANWTPTEYTITCTLNGGTVENPEVYTVESESITLVNPTKVGYTFLGWTGSNGETVQLSVTIPTGSTGSKAYTANWSDPIEYTITYTLNGGTAENPAIYTVESENITLENPTKLGYNFVGWTGTDLDEETMEVVIPQGSTGNKVYTANFEVITYTITITIDGVETTQNYTVESNSITFVNPTKLGYTFLGWTGSNGNEPELEVVIPQGSTGNKEYVANWSLNQYKIILHIDGETKVINYNVLSKDQVIEKPSKKGFNFLGWTGEDLTEATMDLVVPKGSTGDREYTATWEESSTNTLAIALGVGVPGGAILITGVVLIVLAKQKKIKLW